MFLQQRISSSMWWFPPICASSTHRWLLGKFHRFFGSKVLSRLLKLKLISPDRIRYCKFCEGILKFINVYHNLLVWHFGLFAIFWLAFRSFQLSTVTWKVFFATPFMETPMNPKLALFNLWNLNDLGPCVLGPTFWWFHCIKKMMILIGLYSGFLCATARESTIPPRQQQINAVDDGLDSGLYVLPDLR